MTIPKLDLAPKRTKPLALWNPWDYLVLLYWCFFFPQALRWYVQKFGTVQYEPRKQRQNWRDLLKLLRVDPIQRNLIFQSIILTILFPILLDCGKLLVWLIWSKQSINWGGIFDEVLSVYVVLLIWIVVWNMVWNVIWSMVWSVVWGVAGGVVFNVVWSVMADVMADVMGVGNVVIVFGVVLMGVTLGVARSVARSVVFGVVFGVVLGVAVGLVGSAGGVVFGVEVGVAVGVTATVMSLRLLDWLISYLPARYFWQKGQFMGRMVWLPYFWLRQDLLAWLRQEPALAMHNLNELLAYTLQFIPVVQAVNDWLAEAESTELLPRLKLLIEQPFDWSIVGFGSASLTASIKDEFTRGLFLFVPQRYHHQRWIKPTQVRYDTSARCAYAGYWFLHEKQVTLAKEAFEKIRHLPFGEAIYQAVVAMELALACKDIEGIAAWHTQFSLQYPPEEVLRPQVLAVLQRLARISHEATTAQVSASKVNRSLAINRAIGQVTALLGAPHPSPPPKGEGVSLPSPSGGGSGVGALSRPRMAADASHCQAVARDIKSSGRADRRN